LEDSVFRSSPLESPDLAQDEVFETGVNPIPKDAEQAKRRNV
jgi:hypothetical protein